MPLMTKLGLAALAFVAASGAVTAAAAGGCGDKDVLGARLLKGAAPVQVCAAVDEKTLRSIESGAKRLVLVLSEYRPPNSGQGSLSVTPPGGREQVLGVFPAEAFGREDIDSHRRFLLASPPDTARLDPSAPICVSVKRASLDGSGLARLELKTWTPER